MKRNSEILIVEDSLTQALRLQQVLEREGYAVLTARDGAQALTTARATRPDLIVSDIVMPVMDGYELCRQVKDDPELREVPVVLLTSLTQPSDVFRALEAGADNFISKPYDDATLLSNLRRMLLNIELRGDGSAEAGTEVFFAGKKHLLNSSRVQIIDFLLSTYESALRKNEELSETLEVNKRLQANYRQLLDTNMDAIVVLDGADAVRYANPAADALFGNQAGQVHSYPRLLESHPGERHEIEFVNAEGAPIVAEMRSVRTDWEGESMKMAVLRDITEHVRMRDELRHLSLRDALTGLYNRRGLGMIAEQALEDANRDGRSTFLAFIDMDGFKEINDTYGHQTGDAALCDMAHILQAAMRKCDVVGRVGGDEFAIFGSHTEVEPEDLLMMFAERIEQHNESAARPYRLAMSIGLQCFDPNGGTSFAQMLEAADGLMYEQKRGKRSR